MHFLIVIYMACLFIYLFHLFTQGKPKQLTLVFIGALHKSLAKWWGLFLGTSHFDLEGGQKYPPVGICGGRIPPWNFKYI